MSTDSNEPTIKINGNADYEREVTRMVNAILTFQTGKAIAVKIKTHGQVLIDEDSIDRREVNSEFRPGASRKTVGVIGFHPHNKKLNTSITLYNGKAITLVHLRNIQRNYAGFRPDEILFHELVHAARYVGGEYKVTSLADSPLSAYDNEEDYFAILVTNIYMSERGRSYTDFRKSHELRPKPEMSEDDADPMFFLFEEGNFAMIEKFCKQHTTIAPMLGKAPADFNPIRDYYAFKAGYPVFRPKVVEPIFTPVKITQNETFPPASDDYLISLLQPRFQADDVPGFGGRAQELEKVFATQPRENAAKLLTRLAARSPGDRVAGYFHGHLATATRNKLIKILASSAAR